MLSFEQTSDFAKDLKTLTRRWRSLPGDVATAQAALEVIYNSVNEEVYRQFFAAPKATIITKNGDTEAVKMRLDCKSLGNDKKTRLVFVAVKTENIIYLVELYSKNDKDREDPKRYRDFIS